MTKRKGKKINIEKSALKVFYTVTILTILILSVYLIQIFQNNFYNNLNGSSSKIPIINNATKEQFNNVLGAESEISSGVNDEAFWKEYLSKYPNYFPGWLELARLESEKNNFYEFTSALKKAENLNPNSNEVKELKFRYGLK